MTAFGSGITRQLSVIYGYFSGQSTSNECKEEGNADCIEELSDKDVEQEEGHGDSSAQEEEEGSEREEERDTHLNEEQRESGRQSCAERQKMPLWTKDGS
jgi:hypothetical protein